MVKTRETKNPQEQMFGHEKGAFTGAVRRKLGTSNSDLIKNQNYNFRF